MRGGSMTRQWQILVLLRSRRWTLLELAHYFEVSKRTIMRDLQVLADVPLPVKRIGTHSWDTTFTLDAVPAWPRREATPIAGLRA